MEILPGHTRARAAKKRREKSLRLVGIIAHAFSFLIGEHSNVFQFILVIYDALGFNPSLFHDTCLDKESFTSQIIDK